MDESKRILISPSIIAADYGHIAREIEKVLEAGADWLHLDVMDGHFVPNLTIGPDFIRAVRKCADAVRKCTDVVLDAHLMISNPLEYLKVYADAGANYLTVHLETIDQPKKIIDGIHAMGAKAGLVINPETPFDLPPEVFENLDLFLVMSVDPGFYGQKFNSEVLSKVEEARKTIDRVDHQTYLQIDGGINAETAPGAIAAGADVLVAGKAIFKNPPYKNAISSLRGGGGPPTST